MITQFKIETCSGELRTGCTLPFLNDKQTKEFNTIGYTGKTSKGVKSTHQEYLNSLNKGEFSIRQSKFDNGAFCEEFEIARYTPDKKKK